MALCGGGGGQADEASHACANNWPASQLSVPHLNRRVGRVLAGKAGVGVAQIEELQRHIALLVGGEVQVLAWWLEGRVEKRRR